MTNLEGLIQQHQLKRHPEGGWYRELHRSTALVQRSDAAKRPGLTAILFLLPKDEISCWHRVGSADEAWIHIDGADLNLFQCKPDGSGLQETRLNRNHPLHVVPGGCWQAARCDGSYALVSCCVGPGFDFADFENVAATVGIETPSVAPSRTDLRPSQGEQSSRRLRSLYLTDYQPWAAASAISSASAPSVNPTAEALV